MNIIFKYNSDMSDDYEIRSYTDPELNQIDKKIVKKILFDAGKNHNNLNRNFSNRDYEKDFTMIRHATLTYFENSDYYHISIGYNAYGYSGGYTVVNEMMYKGDKYIGELLIHGSIESVVSMK